jgi:hypothetical protein
METQVDNFNTLEAANKFMALKAFALNLISRDFDPEDLVKRVESEEVMPRSKRGSRLV